MRERRGDPIVCVVKSTNNGAKPTARLALDMATCNILLNLLSMYAQSSRYVQFQKICTWTHLSELIKHWSDLRNNSQDLQDLHRSNSAKKNIETPRQRARRWWSMPATMISLCHGWNLPRPSCPLPAQLVTYSPLRSFSCFIQINLVGSVSTKDESKNTNSPIRTSINKRVRTFQNNNFVFFFEKSMEKTTRRQLPNRDQTVWST